MKFKSIVYIGRFSPFHNAHLETVKTALTQCEQLIIVVGSAEAPRTRKNPWTCYERIDMIRSTLAENDDTKWANVVFIRAVDYKYNDTRWASHIQTRVSSYNKNDNSIGLIGYEKDDSSFYINMFPQWQRVNVKLIKNNNKVINGTDIRKIVEQGYNFDKIVDLVPYPVYNYLLKFSESDEQKELKKEHAFIETYKQQFSMCPYPPIFVTCDAVVIQSGHVLMVKRKDYPGKGLWALPGGFVNANTDNSLQDAVIRELREETKIKIPVPVLIGSIVNSKVFDAIDRSARGRTITHAFHFEMANGPLPKVKGSDDAEKAKFIPLNEVKRNKCFEDHFEIISFFTGI